MHSFAKAKVRVPEDMRLMGFDDLKYAELLATPLTTVSQPSYGVCQAAEKRVSDFSSFVEQRSCHFFGVRGFEQINHFE